MEDIVVVGIAGGTGSGKTTFAHALAQRLGSDATVLTHDNYYRAHDDLTYEQRTHLNYDHPDAFETDLMVRHLAALKRGESVQVPVYDFTVHNRSQKTTLAVPSRIILVEGILIFHWPELRDLMDIKVFVDADADVRILRRALRDMDERGRSLQSVIDQYLVTVKPMHQQYVEPTKQFANIIVPGTDKSQLAVDMLANHLRLLAHGDE
ncbi:MAG: uridine kinase [Coriobacteriales bacterium]|nr:uridine kinase [Coriobacteriales bacterium]